MEQTISDWSLTESEWTVNQLESYPPLPYMSYNGEMPPGPPLAPPPAPQTHHQTSSPAPPHPLLLATDFSASAILRHDLVSFSRGDNPREIRNKAEKQRRDKLNQSIAELAAMVPPVVAASRKIDKTGVLRLTAHYLRAHQYVFGDTIGRTEQDFSSPSAQAVLGFLRGFLLTATYKGIIVVVSQNVNKYLGHSELDLLGQNLFNIVHEGDHKLLKDQLMPKSHLLGPNGELLIPDEPDGRHKVGEALAMDKRRFVVRFKKLTKRSEPTQYLRCHVEGCLRKSDRACRGNTRCCQMVRRARARGDNPCSSGNDVVFVGVVRPTTETFQTESSIEEFRMEYRTRHSVDGEIIQCDQRIALVTGYMTHEVHGVNAMNFMHRDDVRWVIIALREMYDSHRLVGESCYRLMIKSGQFVYMRTRGQLEVDEDTRAVTSFACTNTVVDESEGKYLIRLMKKRFTMLVNQNDNNNSELDSDDYDEPEEELDDASDDKALPVEDPKQLEKVILHLVTDLPSPQPNDDHCVVSHDRSESPSMRLAIIPPKRDRIVNAIGNIYKVLKHMDSSKNLKDHDKYDSENTLPFVPLLSTSKDKRPPYLSVNTTNPRPGASKMSPVLIASSDKSKIDSRSTNVTSAPNQTVVRYATRSAPFTPADISQEATASRSLMSQQLPTIKYHVLLTPRKVNFTESSTIRQVDTAQPGPSRETTPLKRANHFEVPNTRTKKKLQAPKPLDKNEQSCHSNSSSLESFFDKEILETNIESALRALEQSTYPTFPDLVVSNNDINAIITEIENDSQDSTL